MGYYEFEFRTIGVRQKSILYAAIRFQHQFQDIPLKQGFVFFVSSRRVLCEPLDCAVMGSQRTQSESHKGHDDYL